ncbi:MAG: DUF1853 family protein [Halieaceae bacterium]|jgi:hypothetical protein|nr:DUF1853 family protein [Halieaceae bacterium]
MTQAFFKHPCVRDLAWAGFATPLLTCAGYAPATLHPEPFWHRHLAALDASPGPLLRFLGSSPQGRLGLYYERLWQYLLHTDPDVELIGHNIPVRDSGRTVGEFDCLYRCLRTGKVIHLELAVKFYLGVKAQDAWLGPSVRDRLDRKLEHLITRQIQLSKHPAARAVLTSLGIDSCEPHIDIKGYLFRRNLTMTAPPGFNSKNALHRWLPFAEIDSLQQQALAWQVLPRTRWLGPALTEPGSTPSFQDLYNALGRTLEQTGRPAQLVGCDDQGREVARCFITPNDWPDCLDLSV